MAQATAYISLDSLPIELLDMIVQATDRHELPALRFTCKTMNTVAFPVFGKAYFEVCEHILSLHSLQGLVQISAHGTLGAFVRTIRLGSFRFTEEGLHDLERRLVIVEKNYPTKELDATIQQALDQSRMNQVLVYRRNIHEQNFLLEFPLSVGQKLLEKALANLKRFGHVITIGTHEEWTEGGLGLFGWGSYPFYAGLNDLWNDEHEEYMYQREQDYQGTIIMLLAAASHADCQVDPHIGSGWQTSRPLEEICHQRPQSDNSSACVWVFEHQF